MVQETFRLVFAGRLVKGADADAVKRNFQQLFKADAKRVDALFSGKRIVIKKNVDESTARKYQATLRKIGAVCDIEPVAPPAPSDTGVFKAVDDEPQSRSEIAQPGVAEPPADSDAATLLRAGSATPPLDWELEAPGSDLRDPGAVRENPPPPDTGDLSMAPPGADILDEHTRPPPFDVDVGDVTLAPPGSDLLPDEKPPPPPPPDTGDLTVAPPGSDLSPEEKKPPPPPPDAGDLKLED